MFHQTFLLFAFFAFINSVKIENCAPSSVTKISQILISECDQPNGVPISSTCIIKGGRPYVISSQIVPANQLTGLRVEVSLRMKHIGNLGVVKRIDDICNQGIICPTITNQPQWFNMTYTQNPTQFNFPGIELTLRLYSDQSPDVADACANFLVNFRRH